MQSRLYCQSAGLLEALALGDSELSVTEPKIGQVQFIHQIVKELMMNIEGGNVIREGIAATFQESGYVLTFKYILHLLNNFESGAGAQRVIVRRFIHDARCFELYEKRSIAKDFGSAILLLPERAQDEILGRIVESPAVSRSRGRARVQLLFFYMLCGLRLSLCE